MTHALDHAHVLVTGATGFVGQAILERLLADHPDCRVTVLVRARGDLGAQARVDRLLRKPVFNAWRERVGMEAATREFARRVTVLEGDLDDLPPVPADLDVVIHSASSVSFDLPIDESFTHNVAGPAALYDAIRATGADPHVVHVSTSYVHGLRRGVGEERSLDHGADWREELAQALAARVAVERTSRRPAVLRELLDDAERQHGKAGPRAVAQAAEEGRREKVRTELVDAGRERARSLGWTDIYTFTKAMGERVAETTWAADTSGPGAAGQGRRLSIVRPTIIESSLHHPYPGWIDGFKVADPLIAAYGRGILPEFPALADTVLDVIPVDMVVNVVLAAANRPPERGTPQYFQVSSGTTNPLPFGELYRIVQEYFGEHPLTDDEGQSVMVPSWTFPERGAVPRGLQRRERAVGFADRALTQVPATATTRKWQASVAKARRDLGRLRKFMELYQPYTQTELIFDDANTRALLGGLSETDRRERGFDVTGIDWRTYLQEIHIPHVPGLTRPSRGRSTPKAASAETFPQRTDVLAVFDLQRTVASANPLEHHLWVELERARATGGLNAVARVARLGPQIWRSERTDRGDFIRSFMRTFAGVDDAELRALIADRLAPALRENLLREAIERIAAHRAAGHRAVLITGEIDVFVEPFADLFDLVVAGRADVDAEGRWTGHLAASPLVGEARATWLRRYAREEGMDLAASYAYGDSYVDRAWLEVVGHPHAVNPDSALFRHAHTARWPVLTWHTTGESRLAPVARALGLRR